MQLKDLNQKKEKIENKNNKNNKTRKEIEKLFMQETDENFFGDSEYEEEEYQFKVSQQEIDKIPWSDLNKMIEKKKENERMKTLNDLTISISNINKSIIGLKENYAKFKLYSYDKKDVDMISDNIKRIKDDIKSI